MAPKTVDESIADLPGKQAAILNDPTKRRKA